MLENIEIRDISPVRVCFIPEKKTFAQISEQIKLIRSRVYDESSGGVYCITGELAVRPDLLYEVCFPADRVDFNRHPKAEYQVLPRVKAICCTYNGKSHELEQGLFMLKERAEQEGYFVEMPLRYYFTVKKPLPFHKTPIQ